MRFRLAIAAGCALLTAPPIIAARLKCSRDTVKVGVTCVDRYEASVWSIPPDSTTLIKQVQKGRATLAHLTGGGATQLGIGSTINYPCGNTGNGCKDLIYAVSLAGVPPSANITWFQAQQACGNSGKRLLTNAEWQMAAAGTPDGAPCVVQAKTLDKCSPRGLVATGRRGVR